jgi:hypothetical protein
VHFENKIRFVVFFYKMHSATGWIFPANELGLRRTISHSVHCLGHKVDYSPDKLFNNAIKIYFGFEDNHGDHIKIENKIQSYL